MEVPLDLTSPCPTKQSQNNSIINIFFAVSFCSIKYHQSNCQIRFRIINQSINQSSFRHKYSTSIHKTIKPKKHRYVDKKNCNCANVSFIIHSSLQLVTFIIHGHQTIFVDLEHIIHPSIHPLPIFRSFFHSLCIITPSLVLF